MKIIYNRFLPFPGFAAIMLFGKIFARWEYEPLSISQIRHEEIHRAQAKDFKLSYLGFYAVYLWYWVGYGYWKHPFEIEASRYQSVADYLDARDRFAWRKYKRT